MGPEFRDIALRTHKLLEDLAKSPQRRGRYNWAKAEAKELLKLMPEIPEELKESPEPKEPRLVEVTESCWSCLKRSPLGFVYRKVSFSNEEEAWAWYSKWYRSSRWLSPVKEQRVRWELRPGDWKVV